MKHNKKRNTAFLYEALIRELTNCALKNDINRAKNIKAIILEHFNSSTELFKEMQLFNSLKDNTVEKELAEKYLQEVKSRYDKLDKKNIFNEQTKLINKINKSLGITVYENFVPFYKDLATVAQIFSCSTPIKEKIVLENKLLEKITLKEKEKTLMDQVDKIVFREFSKKFNEKYSNSLLLEQKELLNKFVNSHEDSGLHFKIYLNEEIERLKTAVEVSLGNEQIASQQDLVAGAEKTLNFLKGLKDVKELSNDMLQKILKIQQYVHEVNN